MNTIFVQDYGKCRILLVDDHPGMRRYIREILAAREEFEIIAEADDGLVVLELLRSGKEKPDVILMDLAMPQCGGIEATRIIKAGYPAIKVLVLSVYQDEDYVIQAIEAGACGYLAKDDANEELASALGAILHGRLYLSPGLPESCRMHLAAQDR